ncbi:MAG: glycosyltransferase family 2 protein [Microthrixaceae bacterium]
MDGTREAGGTPAGTSRSTDLVIIPAFNEAATLPAVLADLRRTLPEVDVVVIDDGSSDATATAASSVHGVTVLQLPFNLGIGGALRTGFRYAVAEGYQRGVQLDADGQHDPTLVPGLLAALDGADLVIGTRFGDGAVTYDVGHTRRGAMRVLQFALRLLSGRQFTDTSSGFRAFNRPVLEYFARSYPSEYMESVEVLLAASYEGFRIAEVPVQMHERAGGQPSAHRFRLVYHYVRVLLTLVLRASRRRPDPVGATT